MPTPKMLTCGNCSLFDRKKQECKVTIFHEGQKYHVPVYEDRNCFFVEVDREMRDAGLEGIELDRIRTWKEGNDIKIEYPESLDSPVVD